MQILTSEMTKKQLHDLTAQAIKYISDGYIENKDKSITRTSHVTDLSFFTVTDDNQIALIDIAEKEGVNYEVNKLELTPELLNKLFVLFENVSEHHLEKQTQDEE